MTETIELAPAGATRPDAPTRDAVTFIGNATLLIEWAGFRVLTDPNFVHRGEQVDLGSGLDATRLTDPALDLDELPQIDAVVLTHLHGDRFDELVETRLGRDVPIITTPSAADELRDKGFSRPTGLETWSDATLDGGATRLAVTALPARHGPPLVTVALPDVMGALLRVERSGADGAGSPVMYLSGDTLAVDELGEIPERIGALDVAFLHVGGTRLLGLTVSMDAEQAVRAMQLLEPRVVVPVHFDDYNVFPSTLEMFEKAADAEGLGDLVRVLPRGEPVALETLVRAA